LKIFRIGGTIQDGDFFFFLFSKIWQKSIPFCKMILIKKYSYFLEKINNWKKNQYGSQKPRWRKVDNYFVRNLTETPPSGFGDVLFMQIC
jgi:hypothetical protein